MSRAHTCESITFLQLVLRAVINVTGAHWSRLKVDDIFQVKYGKAEKSLTNECRNWKNVNQMVIIYLLA